MGQYENKEIERLAMNIVFQIGDALYEALPKDIAHEHFVAARQATNDVAIDFAMKLITQQCNQARRQSVNLVLNTLVLDGGLQFTKKQADIVERVMSELQAQAKETEGES